MHQTVLPKDIVFPCSLRVRMCASLHNCVLVHNLLLCARTHSSGSDGSDFLLGKQSEWERAQSEPANGSGSRACWERRVYKYSVTTAVLVGAADRRGACWDGAREPIRKEEDKD